MLLQVLHDTHKEFDWMTTLDYVYGACSVAERERWPRIGLSTIRGALNLLCKRYNDAETKSLVCFVCAQIRTTCSGYPCIDLNEPPQEPYTQNTEIAYWGTGALHKLEMNAPGTLLNNCSYELWQARYVHQKRSKTKVNPLEAIEPQGFFFPLAFLKQM